MVDLDHRRLIVRVTHVALYRGQPPDADGERPECMPQVVVPPRAQAGRSIARVAASDRRPHPAVTETCPEHADVPARARRRITAVTRNRRPVILGVDHPVGIGNGRAFPDWPHRALLADSVAAIPPKKPPTPLIATLQTMAAALTDRDPP